MALTYRSVKGSALTIKELDDNFRHFTGSQAITGSISADSFSGSFSGSFEGDGTNLTGVTATLPAGVISSSAQISELGFISSSVTASMSVATASFVNTLEQDLTLTGSFSVLSVSGSNQPPKFNIDFLKMEITGGLDISRDLIVGDDLFVDDETTLRKETTIGYRNFSNDDFSYNLNVTASTNSPNSARFDGGIVITGSSTIIGNITASGQISSSATVRGQNIIAANQLQGNDLDIVTNAQIGGYLNTSGSVIFRNLSTTEPTVTGSLWISGSGIGSHSGSGYLMIFNP